MTTNAQVAAALNALVSLTAETKASLGTVTTQMNALSRDASAPGAIDTYDTIYADFVDVSQSWNSSKITLLGDYELAVRSNPDLSSAEQSIAIIDAQRLLATVQTDIITVENNGFPKLLDQVQADPPPPAIPEVTPPEVPVIPDMPQSGDADKPDVVSVAASLNAGESLVPALTLDKNLLSKTGDDSGSTKKPAVTTTSDQILPGGTPDRLKNPLSNFSSSAYQITLYMITPDAYDAFNATGRKNINALQDQGPGGAFVVAQSGGVNNSTSKRAPGFELDYYIDNLKLHTEVAAKVTGGENNTTKMTFTIKEPYGFSLVSNLKKAADALAAMSNTSGMQKAKTSSSRQFFILSVRFQGYNSAGQVVTGKDMFTQDTFSPGSAGVFERFYDIFITKLSFKIDGNATTYNLEASSVKTLTAFGAKHGRTKTPTTIVAATVADALGEVTNELGAVIPPSETGVIGLTTTMNQAEKSFSTHEDYKPNKYSIKFVGPDASDIYDASMIIDATHTDNNVAQSDQVKSAAGSNPSAERQTTISKSTRSLLFRVDSSVIQIISSIIARSKFLENALNVIKDAERDARAVEAGTLAKAPTRTVKWFNISADLSDIVWDTTVGDWSFHITYIIQTYETPAVSSLYTNSSSTYYGPHKRYYYWLTGQNSEVLKYEQTLDNTYYNVALPYPNDTQSDKPTATIPGQQQDAVRGGSSNSAIDAANSYTTLLKSPGDWAEVRLQIMGDPDFLVQDGEVRSVNAAYNRFYEPNGFTIKPNGGEVFIELEFNEAKDYDNDTGLLKINNQIVLWEYPAAVKVKGISLRVITVESTFVDGKFYQDLRCTVNTFPGVSDKAATTVDDSNDRLETNRLKAKLAPNVRVMQTQPRPSEYLSGRESTETGGREPPENIHIN